jgi:hypothetical protein
MRGDLGLIGEGNTDGLGSEVEAQCAHAQWMPKK